MSEPSEDPHVTKFDVEARAKKAKISSAVHVSGDLTIELSELEDKIFNLLRDVCKHFDLKTTMRVAGGWVRDKLLKKASDDIDIALDDMMGIDFANKVNEYLKHIGHPVRSIGLINSNPEKSKHLEVATFHVFGIPIDVNNLRKETYADSRIPVVEPGTPEEDVMRRDFTINAMFFNINTSEVEDLTGHGISDLKAGLIRTPCEPKITFEDDPLRVIRAARFAGRYGYDVHPDLVAAASHPDVKLHLNQKVSRERFGTEVEKMMKHNTESHNAVFNGSPAHAFKLLCDDFGLYGNIFTLPEKMWYSDRADESEDGDENKVDELVGERFPLRQRLDLACESGLSEEQLQSLSAVSTKLMQLSETYLTDDRHTDLTKDFLLLLQSKVVVLAAFFAHLHGLECKTGKKPTTVIFDILRDALRLRISDSQIISDVVSAAVVFSGLLNHPKFSDDGQSLLSEEDRQRFCLVIGTELERVHAYWHTAVYVSFILGEYLGMENALKRAVNLKNFMVKESHLLDRGGCWKWPPLLNVGFFFLFFARLLCLFFPFCACRFCVSFLSVPQPPPFFKPLTSSLTIFSFAPFRFLLCIVTGW